MNGKFWEDDRQTVSNPISATKWGSARMAGNTTGTQKCSPGGSMSASAIWRGMTSIRYRAADYTLAAFGQRTNANSRDA